MYRVLIAMVVIVFPVFANAVESQLSGSEWGYVNKDTPFVQFGGDGKISGHGGCNRFFGSFTVDDDSSIDIGPLGATRMACEENLMSEETNFLNALDVAKTYKSNGLVLMLYDESGVEIMELVRRDAD